MKTTYLILLSFLVAFPVSAFDEFDTSDYVLEGVCIALKMIDRHQTLEISSSRPKTIMVGEGAYFSPQGGGFAYKQYTPYETGQTYHEVNPLLGDHPSRSEVNRYFLLSSLIHIGGSIVLPKNFDFLGCTISPRRIWQYTSISISSALVFHNYRVGLSIGF